MTRPVKGTPEWALWIAAIEVATGAPLKRGTSVASAQVLWSRIEALREALDDLGIDWRTALAKQQALRTDRR